MPSYSEKLADWVCGLDFDDLPADVVASTKDRVLDVIGLALAGLADAIRRIGDAGLHGDEPAGAEPDPRQRAAG